MITSTTTHPQEHEAERGSITVFGVIMVVLIGVVLALVIDGAGHIHARQEANAIAREGARVAGQAVAPGEAVLGDVAADPYLAVSAAQQYLSEAGVDGSARVEGGRTVVVTVYHSYTPRFGIGGTSTAVGEAEADLTQTIGAGEV